MGGEGRRPGLSDLLGKPADSPPHFIGPLLYLLVFPFERAVYSILVVLSLPHNSTRHFDLAELSCFL